MINKIGFNPVNFKGQIVKNDLLKDVLDYAKQSTITNLPDSGDFFDAERVTDVLDYIINKTPDSDIFEFSRKNATNNEQECIILKRNGEKIVSSSYEAKNTDLYETEKKCIDCCLKMFNIGLVERVDSETFIKYYEISDQLSSLDKKYDQKEKELIEKHHTSLSKDLDKLEEKRENERQKIAKEYYNIRNKRVKETQSRLKELSKKTGVKK